MVLTVFSSSDRSLPKVCAFCGSDQIEGSSSSLLTSTRRSDLLS